MGKLQPTARNTARERSSAQTNEKERGLNDGASVYRNAIGQVDLLSGEQVRVVLPGEPGYEDPR